MFFYETDIFSKKLHSFEVIISEKDKPGKFMKNGNIKIFDVVNRHNGSLDVFYIVLVIVVLEDAGLKNSDEFKIFEIMHI